MEHILDLNNQQFKFLFINFWMRPIINYRLRPYNNMYMYIYSALFDLVKS